LTPRANQPAPGVRISLQVELAKDTAVDGSVLHAKGATKDEPVETAAHLTQHELNSYANDNALQEVCTHPNRTPSTHVASPRSLQIRYFTATSPTGVVVRVEITAYMRLPAAQCRAPIIKFETTAGQIHLEGSALECARTLHLRPTASV
jgi:hypothetical protein